MTRPADAARKLVLMRHAKSAWPDVPDHDRPLARRGQRDAPVMGRWLLTAGHRPDQVLCSTARRARETWQLAQARLGCTPPVSFDDRVYTDPARRLLDLIRQVDPSLGAVLLVGHDPAIPELALMLANSRAPALIERMQVKFPTAAIAVLEFSGIWAGLAPESTRLSWFVTPRDLRARRRDAR
jgi:phosphohistidine phosphatase